MKVLFSESKKNSFLAQFGCIYYYPIKRAVQVCAFNSNTKSTTITRNNNIPHELFYIFTTKYDMVGATNLM